MPDQIDLSVMQSALVSGGGFSRLRRYWAAPESTFWDDIWTKTGAESYWRQGLAGHCLGDYGGIYKKYLKPGADILEAGCGLGQIVLSLRCHGFRAVGLDFARNTIGLLSARFPDCGFTAGDIHDLPFPDQNFDGYISLGVIEHFQTGQSQILGEANRVLRPGGMLFLSVPAFNRYRRLRAAMGVYRNSEPTMPFFEDCYSEQEISCLLINSGFQLEQFVYTNPVMTLMQESILRPIYRMVEDLRPARAIVDRIFRCILPRPWFGHMVMAVARKL